MQCNRAVYFSTCSRYTASTFENNEHFKLIYIPKEGKEVIPCLLYTQTWLADKKVLVYFHGSYEDLGWEGMTDDIIEMGDKWNVNVLVVEYPGYGLNFGRGVSTTEDLKYEAARVVQYL
jgi:hypothetical protein